MTYATENPTLAKLIEKYNSTALKLNYKGEPIRGGSVTEGDWERDGVAVLANKDYIKGPKGEIRWVSNNSVPPTDILEMAVVDGTITMEEFFISGEQKDIDTTRHFAQYAAMREKHGYSQEERAEMKAAFGDEEVVVVDVITGQQVAI
jgi:hypothetical protein